MGITILNYIEYFYSFPNSNFFISKRLMTYHFLIKFQTGFPVNTESERHTTFYSLPSSLERTPTKVTAAQKVTFCSHGNSAFQPIASSCKIVPQSQVTNPESPGKSFQPITMSCKIVSGTQKIMGVLAEC
jgi:hypothetical protein